MDILLWQDEDSVNSVLLSVEVVGETETQNQSESTFWVFIWSITTDWFLRLMVNYRASTSHQRICILLGSQAYRWNEAKYTNMILTKIALRGHRAYELMLSFTVTGTPETCHQAFCGWESLHLLQRPHAPLAWLGILCAASCIHRFIRRACSPAP